jgi:hypothetical protein
MAEVLDVSALLPNRFQTKAKNRWIFQIEGIDAFLIKTAQRPTVTTDEAEIPFINSRRYVATLTKFNEVNVTLYDAIAPSGAQQVMEWIRLHFESVSGRAGYADFYKRDVQLKLVDPIGTVIELWDGKGVFIKSANFGDLTYEEGNPLEIQLTLRADNWVLQY